MRLTQNINFPKRKFSILWSILLIIWIIIFPGQVNAEFQDLIITEVLPNPIGRDTDGEFIEIYNQSGREINVSDYNLDGRNIVPYPGETLDTLHPEEFVIIHDDNFDIKSSIPGDYKRAVVNSTSFSNSNDSISIYLGSELIDIFEYTSTSEGATIVRPLLECNDNINIENINISDYEYVELNGNSTSLNSFDDIFLFDEFGPTIEIFNNSIWNSNLRLINSTEATIKINLPSCLISNLFQWSIDGETFNIFNSDNFATFPIESNSTTELTIKYPTTNLTKIFEIINAPEPTPTSSPTPTNSPTPITSINKKIRINEIHPNPVEGFEWIELYNFGNEDTNLNNWKIEDLTSIKNLPDLTIEAHSYLIIEGTDLKITLNNSGDEIGLISPDGEIISQVSYTETKQGISWAYFDGNILETNTITKNSLNLTNSQGLIEKSVDIVDDILPSKTEDEDKTDFKTNTNELEIKDFYTKVKDTREFKIPQSYIGQETDTQNEVKGSYIQRETIKDYKMNFYLALFLISGFVIYEIPVSRKFIIEGFNILKKYLRDLY